MGMFTTLFRERKCDRCGEPYLADYQFHTGNDTLDRFKDGDLVPNNYPRKVTYEASYTPLCGFCQSFIAVHVKTIREDAERTILESGCDVRRTNVKSYLWKGKEQVAEFYSTGWFYSPKPGKAFKAIEAKLVERWRRQLKAAAIERWVKISREWKKSYSLVGNVDEYRVGLYEDVISNLARVHLGKRFRTEEIDLGGKDARTHLMDKALGIKRPEGK